MAAGGDSEERKREDTKRDPQRDRQTDREINRLESALNRTTIMAAIVHTSCLSPLHGFSKVGCMMMGPSPSVSNTIPTTSSVVRRNFAVGGGGARSEASTVEAADQLVQLGKSDVRVSQIGIGAWSWGDTIIWNGSWDDKNIKETRDAFNAGMDGGLTFFDTAEVYGTKWKGGDSSESLLGR